MPVLQKSRFIASPLLQGSGAGPALGRPKPEPSAGATLAQRVRAFERQEIQKALEKYGSSLEGKKKAAAALGISLSSLYSKLGGAS